MLLLAPTVAPIPTIVVLPMPTPTLTQTVPEHDVETVEDVVLPVTMLVVELVPKLSELVVSVDTFTAPSQPSLNDTGWLDPV